MAKQSQQPVGDQFYVTHCATADSVLNNPGYTVRAASSDDRDALEAAFRYPPYELPIDLWRDLPPVAMAPRRLALTSDKHGVWAVHSAFLAADSVGRPRSYFSHLLLLPTADPLAVLESWGAPGWATEYKPGAPKALPEGALPAGELVGEGALTAFLGAHPPGPIEVSACVCPERLRGSAKARREVLARIVHAVLLRAVEAEGARARLYVHAEPGLVALGLYAAVRLLPARVTQGLTFSTFEPYHRNVREYKLADVVGTYLGAPEKGLDPDLGTTRGFALDTFVPARSSPELRGPLPAGLNELLDLVAEGEWKLLARVRRDVGADAAGLANVGAAARRARLGAKLDIDAAALKAGTFNKESEAATIDDLLALKADPLAAKDLAECADAVWEKVHRHLHRADVRAAFRDLIATPDRIRALWEEAVEALLNEDFRTWDARWAVVREAGGREHAHKRLAKFIGERNEERLSRLPTDVRAKVRAACADVNLFPTRALLVPMGLGELGPLLAAHPEHAGYTAFVLLAPDSYGWLNHVPPPNREQMRKAAREFLFKAPSPAVAAYVRGAREFLDTDSTFLDVLFTPYSEGAARLMSGLLAAGTLEPSDWRKLCDSVRLTENEWGAFLLEKNHLSQLLAGLGGDGTGRDVWHGYLNALSPALLAPDLIEATDEVDPAEVSAWERHVHAQLRLAGEKLTAAGHKLAPALPEGGVGKLTAANSLVKWTADPAAAERAGTAEVHHACAAFEVTAYDLARAAFRAGGYRALDLTAELPKLEPLLALFRTAFPTDAPHNARSAVTYWLKLSQEFPKGTRAVFQSEFVLKCVPELYYRDLLTEARQVEFEPVAKARINQVLQGKVKPAAQKGARPALPEPEFANEVAEDDTGDGELPGDEDVAKAKPRARSKARGSTGTGGYKHARRARAAGGNGVLYLIAGGLLIAVLVVAAVLVARGGKGDAPQPPPPKADRK